MRKTELLKTIKQKLAIRYYSKRTIDSYLSAINHFANWLIQEKVTTVNVRVVEKYLFELKGKIHEKQTKTPRSDSG